MFDCIQVLVLKEADDENITELCRNLFWLWSGKNWFKK